MKSNAYIMDINELEIDGNKLFVAVEVIEDIEGLQERVEENGEINS
jgi:C4-type Zn-finger protein